MLKQYKNQNHINLKYQFTKDIRHIIKYIISLKRKFGYTQYIFKKQILELIVTYSNYQKKPLTSNQLKLIFAILRKEKLRTTNKAIITLSLQHYELNIASHLHFKNDAKAMFNEIHQTMLKDKGYRDKNISPKRQQELELKKQLKAEENDPEWQKIKAMENKLGID